MKSQARRLGQVERVGGDRGAVGHGSQQTSASALSGHPCAGERLLWEPPELEAHVALHPF
jgi:hypothetical protein